MVNGWELTSELTSKWINFKNTQSNFTLISLITFEFLIKLRQIYRALAVIPGDSACKITWETDENLTSALTSKWINFKNTQSNFTLISLLTFEVLDQTSPNLQGTCRNTRRWCVRNSMANEWELTSELTFKRITFKNTQSNFTLISLITIKVLAQTLLNSQGSCCNTSQWCLQNHMVNG